MQQIEKKKELHKSYHLDVNPLAPTPIKKKIDKMLTCDSCQIPKKEILVTRVKNNR